MTTDISKEEKYEILVKQIISLIDGETNIVGILANVSAAIHDELGYFWVGFYLEKDGVLQLGPFQGPVACFSIKPGRGVCGTSFEEGRTLIVPNVHDFPGHIACSSLSESEIVVPIIAANGKKLGVIDIDSTELNTFDSIDQKGLERIAQLLAEILA